MARHLEQNLERMGRDILPRRRNRLALHSFLDTKMNSTYYRKMELQSPHRCEWNSHPSTSWVGRYTQLELRTELHLAAYYGHQSFSLLLHMHSMHLKCYPHCLYILEGIYTKTREARQSVSKYESSKNHLSHRLQNLGNQYSFQM